MGIPLLTNRKQVIVMFFTFILFASAFIFLFNLPHVNATQTEDLTTFTEVDPSSHWSQTAARNTGSGVTRAESSYVYKDYGSNFFTGNFNHNMTTELNSQINGSSTPMLGVWALCNTYGDWAGMDTNALKIRWYTDATVYVLYMDKGSGNLNISSHLSLNTPYYLTISRSGSILTLNIYSDSARSVLVNSTSGNVGTTAYRYLEVGYSRDSASGPSSITGYMENLDIGTTDTTVPTFGVISATNTLAGQSATVSCTVADNVAVSFNYVGTNNSGVWTDANQTAVAGAAASLTLTWNATVGNVVGVQVWANDTTNNQAYSAITYFTLTAAGSFSGKYLGVDDGDYANILGVDPSKFSSINGMTP